jgi:hypothetical protein
MMALGSSYWEPPAEALQNVAKSLGHTLSFDENFTLTAICSIVIVMLMIVIMMMMMMMMIMMICF